jgi:hypothetical protein
VTAAAVPCAKDVDVAEIYSRGCASPPASDPVWTSGDAMKRLAYSDVESLRQHPPTPPKSTTFALIGALAGRIAAWFIAGLPIYMRRRREGGVS